MRTPLRADYVLEYEPGLPIAVVEAKREYAIPGKGLQQAKNYAQLLDVPFAYSTNGKGIVEDDRDTGLETDNLAAFPVPEELWARYRAWKGHRRGLGRRRSRCCRSTAASATPTAPSRSPATTSAPPSTARSRRSSRGDKRLLLTMATGTGKTFVSMQIVWKLWNSGWRPGSEPADPLPRRPQHPHRPADRARVHAGVRCGRPPIWKLQGEAKAGREIYFALYQQLADSGEDPDGMFREFAPDFFDLVIVDECHRGSARGRVVVASASSSTSRRRRSSA